MGKERIASWLGLLTAAALVAPPQAVACGGILCVPAQLYPPAGPVPPGLAQLLVSDPGYAGPRDTWVVVSDAAGAWELSKSRPPVGDTVVELLKPLLPGARYVGELSYPCEAGDIYSKREWLVETASAAPTALGALRVVESGTRVERAPVKTGACYGPVAHGFVDVELDLAALSPGWRNVLQDVQVLVDDKLFSQPYVPADPGDGAPIAPPLEPPAGRRFHLTTTCQPGALLPGKHSVRVRATVPSKLRYQLESPAVEVDLPCPQLDDAGVAVVSDAGTSTPSDAGSVQVDARVEPDAQPLSQDIDIPAASCAVSAGQRSQRATLWGLGGLVLAGSRLRRRRRQ